MGITLKAVAALAPLPIGEALAHPGHGAQLVHAHALELAGVAILVGVILGALVARKP